MSLERRLARLEDSRKKAWRCPVCGWRIIYREISLDGTVDYPLGEPCTECSGPPTGINLIEVVSTQSTEGVEGEDVS